MTEEDKLKELGFSSPQESIAKAIDRLSSKDRIKMMSNLKGTKEVADICPVRLKALDLALNCR